MSMLNNYVVLSNDSCTIRNLLKYSIKKEVMSDDCTSMKELSFTFYKTQIDVFESSILCIIETCKYYKCFMLPKVYYCINITDDIIPLLNIAKKYGALLNIEVQAFCSNPVKPFDYSIVYNRLSKYVNPYNISTRLIFTPNNITLYSTSIIELLKNNIPNINISIDTNYIWPQQLATIIHNNMVQVVDYLVNNKLLHNFCVKDINNFNIKDLFFICNRDKSNRKNYIKGNTYYLNNDILYKYNINTNGVDKVGKLVNIISPTLEKNFTKIKTSNRLQKQCSGCVFNSVCSAYPLLENCLSRQKEINICGYTLAKGYTWLYLYNKINT